VSELRALAARVAAIPAAASAAAAETVAVDVRAAGATWAPAGVGIRGRRQRLDARVDRGPTSAVVVGTPAGPWVWATRGTGRHRIAPPAGRVLAGGLRHPVSVPVEHQGMRGADVFPRAVARAADVLGRAVVAEIARAV